MNIKKLMGATALVGVLAAFPSLAVAQASGQDLKDAPGVGSPTVGETQSDTAPGNEGAPEIVVTGTRINRPNLESSVPITSVTAAELPNRGSVAIGDLINQLPQMRSTVNQANSQNAIGRAGISALDLRGLGTARTLVLIDGRRIVTATPGVNRPDVNVVPNDLLERFDVITGGNSAI